MIYTVTFNPSLDYFVYLDHDLIEGGITKADSTSMRAGGKGINISLVLANMNICSRAIMFLGGCIGDLIEKELSAREEIELIKIKIDEENRINVKIKNHVETAINANGPVVTRTQQDNMLHALSKLQSDDYVLISGSFCQGVDAQLVEQIGALVTKAKAKLITDIPNLTIENYIATQPYLIKPNLEELADIFNTSVTIDNYQEYVEKLIDAGVENVLVSLGKNGSYFANQTERIKVGGPEVEVINTVGCGDSMLAYTVAAITKNLNIEEAIKYGEAAGRAKARAKDLPTDHDVQEIYKMITIEKVR